MKKYLWGNYLGKKYSLIEIDETVEQIVLRPVGSKNHVTLHRLHILSQTNSHYTVEYQKSRLTIPKNTHSLVSYNWNSPTIKGVWSTAKVDVAKKLGFKNPDKHATSSQGILAKFVDSTGYNIGAVRVELNKSSSKNRYLKKSDKISEIQLPEKELMLRFTLSTDENPYKGKGNFSIKTKLGELIFLVDKVSAIKIKNIKREI